MTHRQATFIKMGDTAPIFSTILTDADGAAVDLSEIRKVMMRMTNINTGEEKVNAAATVGVAVGEVEYQWISGDTNVEGTYRVEFKVQGEDWADVTSYPSDGYIYVVVLSSLFSESESWEESS